MPSLPAATGGGRSLSSWITLSVLGAVVLTALALGSVIEGFARRHELQQAGVALAQVGWQLREQLDRGMAERQAEIVALAGSQALRALDDPGRMRDALHMLQRKAPLCAWIGVADREGRVLAATGGLLESRNVSERPWFRAALQGPFAGDLHAAVLLEQLLPRQAEPWRFVDLAAPVVVGGTVRAVIGAHLSWEWARDIERQLLAPVLRDRGIQTFVVQRDGEVLLGPAGSVGRRLDLPALRGAAGGPGSVVAWPQEGEFVTALVATQGHGDYPGLGWSVVVRQPRAVALAPYGELQQQLVLAAAAVSLLLGLLAPLVGRRLGAPLAQITDWLRSAEASATLALRGYSYREASWLLGALHGLRERLLRQAQQLQDANAGLEQRVAERTAELQRSRELLQRVADHLPAMVALVDARLCYRFVNEAYRQCRAASLASLIGHSIEEVLGRQRFEVLWPHLQGALAGERQTFEQTMCVEGRERHVEVNYVPQRDPQGGADGFMVLVYDVTERKQLELRLARDASHDGLTGLPNRRQLMALLSQAMLRAQRLGRPLALLFLDLDGFKAVNDTHGHEAGDQLLQTVARRLGQSVRCTDSVARLAGDEFVVLLEGVQGDADVQALVAKIGAALAAPVTLQGGAVVRVGASIGVARYAGEAAPDAQRLLAQADAAMYEVKGRTRADVPAP